MPWWAAACCGCVSKKVEKSLAVSKKIPTFAAMNLQLTPMNHQQHLVEVLSFRRGDNLATIATNGQRHVTQEFELCKEFPSLARAISYLEAKGYAIDAGNFQSL